MKKLLIFCDRLMYGALLVMILILPYSLALIQVCQVIIMTAWVAKHFLLFKDPQNRGKAFNLPSVGIGWPLIAIGLLIVLTMPWSHYPALSLKKFFTRFVQQVFLMYCVAEAVSHRRRLYGALLAAMVMGFVVSAHAVSQYLLGHNVAHTTLLVFGRVSGPMHHPNDLGTLLVLLLPIALVFLITGRSWFAALSVKGKPWMEWTALLIFVMLLAALGLTASRGAWIAFAVSMVVFGFCMRRRRAIVFTFLILALFFWLFGMNCLSERVDLYSSPMTQGPVIKPSFANPWGLPSQYNAIKLFTTSNGRDTYWDIAMGVIKKYPWFGCGYSAYGQALKDMQVHNTDYPHNSLLHITAELGIVGLLFYIWLFVAFCWQVKKVLGEVWGECDLFLLGCGMSCGILAWLTHSLLDTAWSSLQLSILLWSVIGILFSQGFRKKGI